MNLDTITRTQLEAAYRLGHRILDGTVPLAQSASLLTSGEGPVQACLVSLHDPANPIAVTLGSGRSWVGRRWERQRPEWKMDALVFEGRQFFYRCRPSGVWLEDPATTNGTALLTEAEALAVPSVQSARVDFPMRLLPHPNEPLPCSSLYRRVARDGDVLIAYIGFVLCHPPTQLARPAP